MLLAAPYQPSIRPGTSAGPSHIAGSPICPGSSTRPEFTCAWSLFSDTSLIYLPRLEAPLSDKSPRPLPLEPAASPFIAICASASHPRPAEREQAFQARNLCGGSASALAISSAASLRLNSLFSSFFFSFAASPRVRVSRLASARQCAKRGLKEARGQALWREGSSTKPASFLTGAA